MSTTIEAAISDRLISASENAPGYLSADYVVGPTRTRVFANDKRVLRWVNEMLWSFRADRGGQADISFYILKTGGEISLTDSVVNRSRLLYRCSMFACREEGSWRWLEVPGKAAAWCDLEKNTGIALINSGSLNSAWVVGHYIFYPLWAQMLKSSGFYHIHGASVALNGMGLLLPGRAGCGKTTLTINLVRNGFKFLGDDTVLLSRKNGAIIVNGFPEEVKMRVGSIGIFPELDFLKNANPTHNRPKLHFNMRDVYGDCLLDTTVPQAIILPKYTGEGRTVIRKMPRAEALASMLRYSLFMADPYSNQDHFRILGELVNRTPCYQADIGDDIDAGALSIKSLLEGPAA